MFNKKIQWVAGFGLAAMLAVGAAQSPLFSDSFEDSVGEVATAYLASPIKQANASISALDADSSRPSGKTDNSGKLHYNLMAERFFVLSVEGGNTGNQANSGQLHAVSTTIRPANVINITPLSDIAYRVVKGKTDRYSERDLWSILNDVAKVLIAQDINGDNTIDYHDVLAFVPAQHQSKLTFDYSELSNNNAAGDNVLDAYLSGNDELVSQLYEIIFAGKLNFNLGGDEFTAAVKIELGVFGDGKVTSDGSYGISYDSDQAENQKTHFVLKSDTPIVLTATPKSHTKIASWQGCNTVSDDKLTCTVIPTDNKAVVANFVRKTTDVVSNVVNLGGQKVIIDGNTLELKLDGTNPNVIALADQVSVNGFIVGTYGNGYLYKVTGIEKLTDSWRKYTVVEAGLGDVITNGTGLIQHQVTHADVATVATSRNGKFYDLDLGSPNLKLLTGDPNSTKFEVVYVKPVEELMQAKANKADEFVLLDPENDELCQTNIQPNHIGEVKKICVQIDDGIALIPAFSYEVKFNLGIDISWGRFKSVQFTPEITLQESLMLNAESAFTIPNKEKMLKFILGKFVFNIGPVPVKVVPQLSFGVYTKDLKASAEFEMGGMMSQALSTGFIYRADSGAEFVGQFDFSGEFYEPTLFLKVGGEAGIRTELGFLLYNLVGPAAGVDAYLKPHLDLEVTGQPLTNEEACAKPKMSVHSGVRPYLRFAYNDSDDVPLVVRPFYKPLEEYLSATGDFRYELDPYERLIWEKSIYPCNDSPAKLVIEGESIRQTVKSDETKTFTFKAKNEGGQTFPLTLIYQPHPALRVQTASGQVIQPGALAATLGSVGDPNDEVTIEVIIDYSQLPIGVFSSPLIFTYRIGTTGGIFGYINDAFSVAFSTKPKFIHIDKQLPGLPAPASLTATVAGDKTIDLSWGALSGAYAQYADQVTYYRLFQNAGCSSAADAYKFLANISADQTSYRINNLPAGDYCFAVQSVNNLVQSASVQSNTVTLVNHSPLSIATPADGATLPANQAIYIAGNANANEKVYVLIDSTEKCSTTANNSGAWDCQIAAAEVVGTALTLVAATDDGAEVQITVNLSTVTPSTATKLNDTGITLCGTADETSNSENCANAVANASGSQIPLGQDGHYGTGINGSKGKSFTTVSGGQCVQDNHTGLMWEVKTDDGGLHDKDNTYTWYSTTNNRGNPGTQNGGSCSGSDCDTAAFVEAVNNAGWCGHNDWRLPTRRELRFIVNYSRISPAIDTTYFPQTQSGHFWSSSPGAGYNRYAWGVHFSYGRDYYDYKDDSHYVRLVRGL